MQGMRSTSQPLVEIPLVDMEPQPSIHSNEPNPPNKMLTTAISSRRSGIFLFSLGMFFFGVILTATIIVCTFIFTIPVDMLQMPRCPEETVGIKNCCIRPIRRHVKSHQDLVATCAEYMEQPATASAVGALIPLLDIFNGDGISTNDSLYDCILSDEKKSCNTSMAVCQSTYLPNPLSDFIMRVRQIFSGILNH
ncbi:membrane protein UL45 [Felid alphaherpesvirus 1]|uniref:Membrane protein UL45 n=1 Tax=Feline herpesvirus 1 TaxID=10334 RepID=Q69365_FHV1|nr:membrane protein UL45 [Felid alphaherpesvirus 1]AMN88945.1 membrane protein UL45 [synthetic construct]ACT88313.1 membrane protein UL45 [Felid alphaherpesvirus 1]ALJ84196.1 membrane protein UL45 [Felid alphaherpesvirus 1]ALJ84272.1 membrane protein UL45 [Felid alphaherpesvirus 1]ALJ84348.1 membrane protein UL45 [Felid alphaherpesvirus 1]